MKTNSNTNHNSVFSSPLPILLVLLVIIIAFAGKLSAGQNSTDVKRESVPELKAMSDGIGDFNQDTQSRQYDRYYRTLIIDPADGREKPVELRFSKDGKLTEVLIEDETLTPAECRENEKLISKAMAEEKKVGKEIEELVEGFGRTMEETMGVISDVFVSVFDDLSDGNDREADSRMDDKLPAAHKRDRKAKLTTLEELESGQDK